MGDGRAGKHGVGRYELFNTFSSPRLILKNPLHPPPPGGTSHEQPGAECVAENVAMAGARRRHGYGGISSGSEPNRS